MVNGERIVPKNLTSTTIGNVFGSAEYSIAGAIPKDEEVNEIQVTVRAEAGSEPFEKLLVLKKCQDTPHHQVGIGISPCLSVIPKPIWKQTQTEKFMEKLWAFKRINYLLGDQNDCSKGIDVFDKDKKLSTRSTKASKNISENCKKEATDLALKYNFVTDVTSMIVEEEDEYVNKGSIHVSKVGKNDLIEEFPVDYDFFLQESNPLSASTFSLSGG